MEAKLIVLKFKYKKEKLAFQNKLLIAKINLNIKNKIGKLTINTAYSKKTKYKKKIKLIKYYNLII